MQPGIDRCHNPTNGTAADEQFNIHAAQRLTNQFFHNAQCHRHRARHPLGKSLNIGQRRCALRRFKMSPELADEIFCRAIVVSQVPGRETCVVNRKHRLKRCASVDGAVRARNLPHSIQQARGSSGDP